MSTDEKIRLLEQRLARIEEEIARAKALYAAFVAGPGRRIARLLGAEVPR